MRNKKGISLIVLIITIVIILILTISVILSLNDKNAIRGARIANLLQTKDAIEASVVIYTSKVRVEWEGKCNTESIIRGLNFEDNDLSKYQVVDDEEYLFTLRNGEEILLYMINVTDFETKANLKVTTPIPKSHWYLDKYGKAYLLFDLDAVIPDFVKDPSDPTGYDPNINSFVYPSNIDINIDVGFHCVPRVPTLPSQIPNEVNNQVFNYSEPDANGDVLIKGFNPTYESISIPNDFKFPLKSYDGRKIVGIADSAFSSSSRMSNVVRLVIPEGYVKIGKSAFYGLNIEEVYIPSTFVNDNTGNASTYAFKNCSKIKKIEIPQPLAGCEISRNRPSSFFDSSIATIEEVNFIGEITSIGEYAFRNFTALKKIDIPCTVTSIGNYAFEGCLAANNDLVIPKTVISIGDSAFKGCKLINSLTFESGSGLKKLGSSCFAQLSKITSLVLPESLEEIGINNFGDCTSLTSVTIYSDLKSIKSGTSNFSGCKSIENITIPNCIANCALTTPATLFSASSESIKTVDFVEGVQKIGNYAFKEFKALENMELPDTVKEIGQQAFYYCTALKGELIIPKSVTLIGNEAFRKCKSITKLTFENNSSLNTLGASCFAELNKITSLVLPESIKVMGNNNFGDCTSLTSVTIYSNLESIASRSLNFSGCSNIENITIPNCIVNCELTKPSTLFQDSKNTIKKIDFIGEIEKIGDYAFQEFKALESIEIPNTVTEIGKRAFYNCTKLSGTLSIPSRVTCIKEEAFDSCSNLTGLSFSSSGALETIEHGAFSGCSKIASSISLPNGLVTLGTWAFYDCDKVPSASIPSSVTTIGEYCFASCDELKSVSIFTVSVESARYFTNCDKLTSISYVNSTGYPWSAPNAPPLPNN